MTLLQILPGLTSQAAPADTTANAAAERASEWELLRTLPVDDLVHQLASRVVHFAIQLAIAVAVFYAGKFIIRKLMALFTGVMHRRRVDPSLSTFLTSMVRIVLFFILIVTVIGILGIETSSFIALFASAGVAIGMALSGTLQNFAGGVLILLLKPYRVGDYIEAQGYAGTVKEIQIFHTIINTPDNKAIIIPNGGLSTGSINNYNREDYRRIDWNVSIAYGDDFDNARSAILDIVLSEPGIVHKYIEDDRRARALAARGIDPGTLGTDDVDTYEPIEDPDLLNAMAVEHRRSWWQKLVGHRSSAGSLLPPALQKSRVREADTERVDRSPVVVLDVMADSSVNLKVRAWAHASLYWKLYYDINRRLYVELPGKGINFPFPQLDVHLTNS